MSCEGYHTDIESDHERQRIPEMRQLHGKCFYLDLWKKVWSEVEKGDKESNNIYGLEQLEKTLKRI